MICRMVKDYMRTCKKCGSQFNEDTPEYDPAQEIGGIFIQNVWHLDTCDLCPKCRRELGMFTLLGFDA